MSSPVARSLLASILLTLLCLLAACGTGEIEGLDMNVVYPEGPTVVRIGLVVPLSGESGAIGRGIRRAIELAVKDANNTSEVEEGGYQFALIVHDDQDNLELAHEAVHSLVDEETVLAVIGHLSSDVTLFTLPVYEEAGLPLITLSTSSLITLQGHRMINRIVPRDDAQGTFAARLALESLDLTRAIVIDHETFHGHAAAEAFEAEFVVGGGPVLAHLHFDPETVDYGRFAEDVAGFHSQVVFIGSDAMAAASLSRALDAAGLDVPVILRSVCCTPEYLALAGSAAEGDISLRWGLSPQQARGMDFLTYYRTAYGEEPDEWAAHAYDAAWIIVRAVLAAGPDRAEVATAIRSIEFEGVTGMTSFDENGDTTNQAFTAFHVVDGEWQEIP